MHLMLLLVLLGFVFFPTGMIGVSMLGVLACSRALRVYVLGVFEYLQAWRAWRAYILLACLRASVLRACVLACFRAPVLGVLAHLF